ncbi:MAG TPA: cytochrome c [Nitrospirota bacterium]|nr:cytochrome c [Nitrospirota bacterium]
MSTSKLLTALVLLAAACGGPHIPTTEYLPSHTRENQSFSGPNLGQEVKSEEIAAWDISIPPDGSGLPPGSGTAAEGEAVYNAKCASCHGAEGIKGPADTLVGGIGTLATKKPLKTVGSYWPYATTLFDYIRRAMPFNAPQSLSNDEVYAVSAYLLCLNGIIDPEMRMDAKTLPQVKMPNRDGFVSYWP